MDIEYMMERWVSQNVKIEDVLRINPRLQLGAPWTGVRAWLGWFRFGAVLEIVLAIPFLLGTESYIHGHIREIRFLLTGVALQLWFISTVVAASLRYARARAIDFSAPVLEIQQRVESLRLFTTRSLRFLFVFGVPMWAVVIPIMALRALGIDLYARISAPILCMVFVGSVALGLAVVKICTLWAGLASRSGAPTWLRKSARAFSPFSLIRAADQLQKIAEFEREQ